jgi:hypothetical protein
MDEENMVTVYSGILFSIKKNKIVSFAGKWMKLEMITLREVSQIQKTNITCFLSYAEAREKVD